MTASSPAAAPHVIPIRFGKPGQELLGLYQLPSGEKNRRECCLLCNPFGQEAMRSHRAYRIIADRLSRSGFHVLRFDYFGTGDSSGGDDEINLDRWIDDVLRADDEIIRRSGCTRSSWFGLRLGASVAALASVRGERNPKQLILWDPILDGSKYLAELASAHIATRSEDFELRWETESELRSLVANETDTEAIGYPLPHNMKTQMNALLPSSFRNIKAGRVTLLSAKVDSELTKLLQQMSGFEIDIRARMIDSNITWTENEILRNSVILPQDIRTLALVMMEEL